MSARGLVGPAVITLLVFLAALAVGWCALLIVVGYFVGYIDPWRASGKRK